MSRQLLTCGEHGLLVELDGLDEVLALNTAVRAAVEDGDPAFTEVVDIVPAARTLLVIVRDGSPLTPLRLALPTLAVTDTVDAKAGASPDASPDASIGATTSGLHVPQTVEILVHYDGPDLDEVCELTGLTPAEVVAAHTQTPWRVAFAGFSPGFAYLFGGDARLQVPRRGEPRTSVPSGSVGLAGEFSAVYPRESPGGWQLLGHTDASLWDVDREPPALLRPGSLVQFVDAARGLGTEASTDANAAIDAEAASR